MKTAVCVLVLIFTLSGSSGFAEIPETASARPSAAGKEHSLYAQSWAVVVGIDRYRSSKVPRRNYAEADARAMARALVRLGFPPENVRLLTGERATRTALKAQ